MLHGRSFGILQKSDNADDVVFLVLVLHTMLQIVLTQGKWDVGEGFKIHVGLKHTTTDPKQTFTM